jgi:hypothetical protein
MLINQHNRHVLPLAREAIKRRLDRARLGLGVHDEEVLLAVGRGRDVPYAGEEEACDGVLRRRAGRLASRSVGMED